MARAPWLQGSLTALTALVLTIPLRMPAALDTARQWYAVLISAAFGLLSAPSTGVWPAPCGRAGHLTGPLSPPSSQADVKCEG